MPFLVYSTLEYQTGSFSNNLLKNSEDLKFYTPDVKFLVIYTQWTLDSINFKSL